MDSRARVGEDQEPGMDRGGAIHGSREPVRENCCGDQGRREIQGGNKQKGPSTMVRDRALWMCLNWRESWMRFPVCSTVPCSQLSHCVWASVSSVNGEDWNKWTQVGLSGSKGHCRSGQKNPWYHLSSPAVPWRGSRDQGGSPCSLIITLAFQPLGGLGTHSMLRPVPSLPQLCLSLHALFPGLTQLPSMVHMVHSPSHLHTGAYRTVEGDGLRALVCWPVAWTPWSLLAPMLPWFKDMAL